MTLTAEEAHITARCEFGGRAFVKFETGPHDDIGGDDYEFCLAGIWEGCDITLGCGGTWDEALESARNNPDRDSLIAESLKDF